MMFSENMASADMLEETLNEVSEFPICKASSEEQYSLLCGHCFCKRCIETLNTTQALETSNCPICRAPNSLPMKDLPRNFAIQSAVSTLRGRFLAQPASARIECNTICFVAVSECVAFCDTCRVHCCASCLGTTHRGHVVLPSWEKESQELLWTLDSFNKQKEICDVRQAIADSEDRLVKLQSLDIEHIKSVVGTAILKRDPNVKTFRTLAFAQLKPPEQDNRKRRFQGEPTSLYGRQPGIVELGVLSQFAESSVKNITALRLGAPVTVWNHLAIGILDEWNVHLSRNPGNFFTVYVKWLSAIRPITQPTVITIMVLNSPPSRKPYRQFTLKLVHSSQDGDETFRLNLDDDVKTSEGLISLKFSIAYVMKDSDVKAAKFWRGAA